MRYLFLAVLSALVLGPAWAQNSPSTSQSSSADSSLIDGLFANPPPDKVDKNPRQSVNPNLYTGQSMKFFENVKASGYYVGGWDNTYQDAVGTPYNSLDFTFGTDVRVDPTVRAYAALDVLYPQPINNPNQTNSFNPFINSLPSQGNLTFSTLTVKELFLDYTLYNQIFFRLGRQSLVWGQGRLFNPGNFVNDIADGVAAKAVTTVAGFNLTGVVIKNDSFYNVSAADTASTSSLADAGMMESSLGPINWGVSGFYQKMLGYKADLYLKSYFLDTDWFAEGVAEHASTDGVWIPSAVAGAYHEFNWGNVNWLKIEAEYMFSGRGGGSNESFNVTPTTFYGYNDQSLGVGLSSDALNFINLKPTFSWLTALKDGSGQMILALSNTTIPHLEISGAAVYIYGPDNGRYVLDNPDTTEHRVLSFTLKVTFTLDGETGTKSS